MNDNNLKISMTVGITPEVAFKAITDVKGWWATNVSGEINEQNNHFTVRFGKTFADIEVIESVPDKCMTWLIENSLVPLFNDPTEWNNTSLKWQLFPQLGGTTIIMTHEGLTPEKECYLDCQKGWSFYITESLQKLMIEGQGMPGTGIFSYVIVDDKKLDGLLYFKNDPLPDYPDGFLYIDVKGTKGEGVTEGYSSGQYSKSNFSPLNIRGDYFMVLENKLLPDGTTVKAAIARTLNLPYE